MWVRHNPSFPHSKNKINPNFNNSCTRKFSAALGSFIRSAISSVVSAAETVRVQKLAGNPIRGHFDRIVAGQGRKIAQIKKPFSFAEGPYQTIYLLRANLAVSLLRRGKSFWMMQQDTFWRRNLFDLRLEDNMSYDAIFDQLGIHKNSYRAEWVNG